jgi:TetR/AcrR family tetracycline transcriptional repressor
VLAAARALLDEEGLERLSMRRLADRLGVAPNALYSHVAGRTELIDALLDETLGEVEAPDPRDGDWRAGLEAIMRRTYAVLLSHPDLVPLYLARRGARGPQAVALGDAMLAMMERGGVEPEIAQQGLRALVIHAIGFAAFAVQDPGDSSLTPEALEAHFVQSVRWLLDGIAAPDHNIRRSAGLGSPHPRRPLL